MVNEEILVLLAESRAKLDKVEALLELPSPAYEPLASLLEHLDAVIVLIEPDGDRYDAVTRGV